MTLDPRILVISLRSATDRRASVQRQLESQSLSAAFIDAVDGRTLAPIERDALNTRITRHYRRPFTASEMGCYLSHLNAYRQVVAENVPYGLILEDDAEIHCDLKALFDAISKLRTAWEFINLGSHPLKRQHLFARESMGQHTLAEYTAEAPGSHAYLITLSAARKLARDFLRPYRPVDLQMSYHWRNGIKGYFFVVPTPIMVAPGFPSTISAERDQLNRSRNTVRAKLNAGHILSTVSIEAHWAALGLSARARHLLGTLGRLDAIPSAGRAVDERTHCS